MVVSAPALKYAGAKWLLAPWIISNFPPHTTYVELFGGSAAVLLRKPPAKYDIYNELDASVVNFFRMLREHPREFRRLIDLTPYSRREFRLCLEPCDDKLEAARRFYARCWMSMTYNKTPKSDSSWRLLLGNTSGGNHVPQRLFARTRHLMAIARRLKNVQIEDGVDFRKLLHNSWCRRPGTLIFADPPYPGYGERLYDMSFSTRDHEELLEDLRNCGAQVVLSGYDDLIPLLPDWHAIRKETRNRKRALRTEVLMLNPLAWENLNAGKI